MTEVQEIKLRKIVGANLKKSQRVDNTIAYVVKDPQALLDDLLHFIDHTILIKK